MQQETEDRKTKFAPRRIRAFTLMEMLVVLAVIALFAVIVMPALTRAHRSANRATCFNNIHQCGLAVSMYIEDYDNVFPTYRVDTHYAAQPESLLEWHDAFCRAAGGQPDQISWVSLTRPYASARSHALQSSTPNNGMDVYYCPEDDARNAAATSYEFKMLLATGLPLSQIHSLAATTLLWEQWAFHGETVLSEYDRRAEMNMVFVDGHTAWVRLSSTTNALYSKGPDLHWLPSDPAIPAQYREEDVAY